MKYFNMLLIAMLSFIVYKALTTHNVSKAASAYEMSCEIVSEKWSLLRCENTEVVCYERYAEATSCFWKQK